MQIWLNFVSYLEYVVTYISQNTENGNISIKLESQPFFQNSVEGIYLHFTYKCYHPDHEVGE